MFPVSRRQLFLSVAIFFPIMGNANHAVAQSKWTKILNRPSGFTTCVAVNPLSKGNIIFSPCMAAAKPLITTQFARSDDRGKTWQQFPIRPQMNSELHQIYCLDDDTSIVFAVADSLYRSTDGGRTWKMSLSIGVLDGETITYHKPSKTLIYMGGDSLGIWTSTDKGATWREDHPGPQNFICTAAASLSPSATILAGSMMGSISRTTDMGKTWLMTKAMENNSTETPKIVYSEANPKVAIATCYKSSTAALAITTNDGQSWTPIVNSVDSFHIWGLDIDQDPDKMLNGIPQHFWTGQMWDTKSDVPAVSETTDGGLTWTHTQFPDISNGVWVMKYDQSSGLLLAASSVGLYAMETKKSIVNKVVESPHATVSILKRNVTDQLLLDEAFQSNHMEITNVYGRIQYSDELHPGRTFELPIDLPSGCYFIRLTNSRAEQQIVKWVK